MEDTEEYYIRVEMGKTVDHPIAGWNLRMIFPDLNPDKLPRGYERFTRSPVPDLTIFQSHVGTEYVRTNYGWTDSQIIVDNNLQISDINPLDDIHNVYPPRPDDGQEYFWADSAGKWINSKVFEKVFTGFLKENNIKYEDLNYKSFTEMNDEQKGKFQKLIIQYLKEVPSNPTKPKPQDGREYVWNDDLNDWYDITEKSDNIVRFITSKDKE